MGSASDCGMSGRNEKAERAGSGEMSAISGSVSCTGKGMMPLAGL